MHHTRKAPKGTGALRKRGAAAFVVKPWNNSLPDYYVSDRLPP